MSVLGALPMYMSLGMITWDWITYLVRGMTKIYRLEKLGYILSYLGFVKFVCILIQVTFNLTRIIVSVTKSKFIVGIYDCVK